MNDSRKACVYMMIMMILKYNDIALMRLPPSLPTYLPGFPALYIPPLLVWVPGFAIDVDINVDDVDVDVDVDTETQWYHVS